MRLFLAFEVPAAVRRALDEVVAPLRERHESLRWSRSDGWHLTVAFLGEVEADPRAVVDAVSPVLDGVPGTVGLSLGAAGRFGQRVLWMGVEDDPAGAVAETGERSQAALAAAGIPVHKRRVHPHLTLARSGRGRVTRAVVAAVPEVPARWQVGELGLLRSHLGGKPARYETLARIPLSP